MINGYEEELPDDVVLVKQIGALSFYFSKAHHAFFIETADCHAGPVKFSETEMMELLSIFHQRAGEKEKELLAELEIDDEEGF